MCDQAGQPVAHVAAGMGISRQCAYKWWRRYQEFGASGLVDRSSRPRRCSTRTPVAIEERIVRRRRLDKVSWTRFRGPLNKIGDKATPLRPDP